MKEIEVRAFGEFMKIFKDQNWPWPKRVEIDGETSAAVVAAKLGIPIDKVEILFINGFAQKPDHTIKPGDRVAFVPPGTPGPYRLMLGLAQKQAKEVELGKKA
jgi:molybdopterin converting factor small subunit